MRILVISLAGIGDVLMATPMIHELRANFPGAVIDALVMWPAARDLLETNPHLNHVYQKNLIRAGARESLKFLSSLRRNRYDISLNTHPQSRIHYRVVARLVGAQERLSHAYDHSGWLDRLLVTKSLPQDYTRPCVENDLALLSLAGAKPLLPAHAYELFLPATAREWAEQYIAGHDLESRRRVGFHVGSGGTKNLALRRWPLGHYIQLIRELGSRQPGLAVMLFGGPEEEQDHARIAQATDPRQVFAPKTKNILEAAALVQKCEVFVSVDTALMHVAAAMKVPRQIVIETPTFNKTVEPYHQPFMLVKNPAVAGRNLDYYRYDGAGIRGSAGELTRCMASIPVADVQRAILEALR